MQLHIHVYLPLLNIQTGIKVDHAQKYFSSIKACFVKFKVHCTEINQRLYCFKNVHKPEL